MQFMVPLGLLATPTVTQGDADRLMKLLQGIFTQHDTNVFPAPAQDIEQNETHKILRLLYTIVSDR